MLSALRTSSVFAWLVPIVILLQAVLAGRGLFVDPGLFGIHGSLGTLTLLLSVVAVGVAWRTGASRTAILLASLTVVGVIAQTGLGYAGRRSAIGEASAAHVALGVALLGLSVAVAMLVSYDQRLKLAPGRPSDRDRQTRPSTADSRR